MAELNSIETELVKSGKMIDASFLGGRVRAYKGSVDAAKTNIADGDAVTLFEVPKGAKLVCGFVSVTASTGTATVKIGKADGGDYLPAQAVTTPNTPVFFTANDDTGGKIVMTVAGGAVADGVITVWALYAGV